MIFTNKINDSLLRGYVRMQSRAVTRAEHMADSGRLAQRSYAAGAVVGALMGYGAVAAHAAGAVAGAGCGASNSSFSAISGFINTAADFAIGIGGVGATLMLAVGAILIIFGGTPSRVRKCMEIIKNAAIGIGVLASGLFIKFVVVNLVQGATSGQSSTNPCLSQGGL